MKNVVLFLILVPTLLFSQSQIGGDLDGEAANDLYGEVVSMSPDGTLIAVASTQNNSSIGHVRVYENQSGSWVKLGNDIDGENTTDLFGWSLFISKISNRPTVFIGSPGKNLNTGYVSRFVYLVDSNTWINTHNTDGLNEGDFFGSSLSYFRDGGTFIIVGIQFNGDNEPFSGQVRYYDSQFSGSASTIYNGDAANDFLGRSVSGSTSNTEKRIIAMGAPGNNSGYVKVFNGGTQIGSNIVGEANQDSFGNSISLSGEGDIIAIGAPFNDGNGDRSGHVRILENQSNNWVQLGSDIDGEASGDEFGTSVSLSSDGTVLAVGARFNNGNGSNSGHVRIYKYQSNTWVQKGSDINGEAALDEFGTSVSLSEDGNTLVVGGPKNNGNGNNSGHARVFDLSLVLSSDDFVLQQFSVFPNPVSDVINVQLKENVELKKINIYNSLGQFISSTTKTTIPTNNLSKGYYFIEIETNNGKASKSVIIK